MKRKHPSPGNEFRFQFQFLTTMRMVLNVFPCMCFYVSEYTYPAFLYTACLCAVYFPTGVCVSVSRSIFYVLVWLINLYAITPWLVLFYVLMLRNCVHCTLIFTFFVYFFLKNNFPSIVMISNIHIKYNFFIDACLQVFLANTNYCISK